MQQSYDEQQVLRQSRPLQSIRTIQQSLMVLKHKLSQMHKRQNQNSRQIQKVFYSSIPNLKLKLSQTFQCQKFQQKKIMLNHSNVLKDKHKLNQQRKMINEKQIGRNKELMNMMKINDHNLIKEKSRKNQLYIQKMKNFRIQQNKKKKQLIRGSIENSRLKIQDFKTVKLDQIKKQKEQQTLITQMKINQMQTQIYNLADKQNQIAEKVDKSQDALKQLRFAVDKLQKMNQNEYLNLKNQVQSQHPNINQQKLIEKMLLNIIETSKSIDSLKGNKSIHKWPSEHLAKKY